MWLFINSLPSLIVGIYDCICVLHKFIVFNINSFRTTTQSCIYHMHTQVKYVYSFKCSTDRFYVSLFLSHSYIYTLIAKCGVDVITVALEVSNNILMSPKFSAGLFNEFLNEIIISMRP